MKKLVRTVEHRRKLANKVANKGLSAEQRAIRAQKTWLPRPKGQELKNLLSVLAENGKRIKGSSFDAIDMPARVAVDFSSVTSIRRALPELIFVEVKTTKRPAIGRDFSGYFFALTENEIAAADVLGTQHRVALHNTVTGHWLMTSVSEILQRAKSTNWQVSISLGPMLVR